MLQKAVDKLLKGPAPIVPSLRGRRSRFPAGLLVDPADDSAAALHDSLSTVSSQVQFSAMESRWGAFYVRTRPEGKGNSAPAVGQPAAPARQRKRAAPDSAVDDAVEPRSRRQRTGDGPRRSSTASRDGTQCLHAHTLDGFVFAQTMSGCPVVKSQRLCLNLTAKLPALEAVLVMQCIHTARATATRTRTSSSSKPRAMPATSRPSLSLLYCRQRLSFAKAAVALLRAATRLGNAPRAMDSCMSHVVALAAPAGEASAVRPVDVADR